MIKPVYNVLTSNSLDTEFKKAFEATDNPFWFKLNTLNKTYLKLSYFDGIQNYPISEGAVEIKAAMPELIVLGLDYMSLFKLNNTSTDWVFGNLGVISIQNGATYLADGVYLPKYSRYISYAEGHRLANLVMLNKNSSELALSVIPYAHSTHNVYADKYIKYNKNTDTLIVPCLLKRNASEGIPEEYKKALMLSYDGGTTFIYKDLPILHSKTIIGLEIVNNDIYILIKENNTTSELYHFNLNTDFSIYDLLKIDSFYIASLIYSKQLDKLIIGIDHIDFYDAMLAIVDKDLKNYTILEQQRPTSYTMNRIEQLYILHDNDTLVMRFIPSPNGNSMTPEKEYAKASIKAITTIKNDWTFFKVGGEYDLPFQRNYGRSKLYITKDSIYIVGVSYTDENDFSEQISIFKTTDNTLTNWNREYIGTGITASMYTHLSLIYLDDNELPQPEPEIPLDPDIIGSFQNTTDNKIYLFSYDTKIDKYKTELITNDNSITPISIRIDKTNPNNLLAENLNHFYGIAGSNDFGKTWIFEKDKLLAVNNPTNKDLILIPNSISYDTIGGQSFRFLTMVLDGNTNIVHIYTAGINNTWIYTEIPSTIGLTSMINTIFIGVDIAFLVKQISEEEMISYIKAFTIDGSPLGFPSDLAQFNNEIIVGAIPFINDFSMVVIKINTIDSCISLVEITLDTSAEELVVNISNPIYITTTFGPSPVKLLLIEETNQVLISFQQANDSDKVCCIYDYNTKTLIPIISNLINNTHSCRDITRVDNFVYIAFNSMVNKPTTILKASINDLTSWTLVCEIENANFFSLTGKG